MLRNHARYCQCDECSQFNALRSTIDALIVGPDANSSQQPTAGPKKPTFFTDLPGELRNRIYELALPSNKAFTLQFYRSRPNWIRIKEPRPGIFYAIRPLREEILSVHYSVNDIKVSLDCRDDWRGFVEWVHRRGKVLQNLRKLHITHQSYCDKAYRNLLESLETKIHLTATGIEVPTDPSRPALQFGCYYDKKKLCGCSIEELFEERLQRSSSGVESAIASQGDTIRDWNVAESGPVIAFALRLMRALELAEAHQREIMLAMMRMSKQESSRMCGDISNLCALCGKRRWVFKY